jgi:hypothetical protein
MIKINDDERKDGNNNSESLKNFIKESKEIYNELMPIYKENLFKEKENLIFKHLSHVQFCLYIVPYLSLKEILILRESSKEINLIINSNFCCINYYYKTLKNGISQNSDKDRHNNIKNSFNQLKPLEELNEESEFLEQKHILNNIKTYIKSREFSIKKLTKIYRVEMDYLKYEERHQIKYMKSLIEIKNKIANEYKMIENKENNNKIKKIEKKKENNELCSIKIDEMKKKIEELKLQKENILLKLNKEKKLNEDLIKKNNDKNNIINKLKNIYLNKDKEEIEFFNLNENLIN